MVGNNLGEEFLNYKQSLTLQELGFDEPCFGFYLETKEWAPASYSKKGTVYPKNSDLLRRWVASPTFQQAFKWFRNKHNLKSWIETYKNDKFTYQIRPHNVTDYKEGEIYVFKKYEKAESVCIDKLIEITKKNNLNGKK